MSSSVQNEEAVPMYDMAGASELHKQEQSRKSLDDPLFSFDMMADLKKLPKQMTAQDVRLAATLSKLAYDVETEEDLAAKFSSATRMTREASSGLPFFRCGIFNGGGDYSLPMVWVSIHVEEGPKHKRFYATNLLLGYRGSQDLFDWTTNFDGRPTVSQDGGMKLHGGMFSVFNNSKRNMEVTMERFQDEKLDGEGCTCKLLKVIFTGHSLGGGVASICNFEMNVAADEESTHWPKEQLRPANSDVEAYAIVFSAPPVFFPNVDADFKDLEVRIEGTSVNFFLEFDLVPRICFPEYVKGAAEATAKCQVDESLPKFRVLTKMAVKHFSERAITAGVDAGQDLMSKLCHLSRLGMIRFHKKKWSCLMFQGYADKWRVLNQAWPFTNGEATKLAVLDHTVFLDGIVGEWRTDHCCFERSSLKCGMLQDRPSEEEDTLALVDCFCCSKTLCDSCHAEYKVTHEKIHQRHQLQKRLCSEKVRGKNSFELVVQEDVEAALSEMNWFKLGLKKELKGALDGAMNVYWLVNGVGDSGFVEIIAHAVANGGVAGVLEAVSHTVGPALIAGVAIAQSGHLLYRWLYCGEITTAAFWKKLGGVWVRALGAFGGGMAGAAAGAALGSLVGPLGTIIGGIVGGVLGTIFGSAVAGSAYDAFMHAMEGASPAQETIVQLGMVCQALMELGLQHSTPSQITLPQVRSAYRKRARDVHPDKTGYFAKPEDQLSKEEKQILQDMSQKFAEIQHHAEVAESFISERADMDKESLKRADTIMKQFRSKYLKIEEEARKQQKEALLEALDITSIDN